MRSYLRGQVARQTSAKSQVGLFASEGEPVQKTRGCHVALLKDATRQLAPFYDGLSVWIWGVHQAPGGRLSVSLLDYG